MESKQIQKAGENSQQIQAGTIIFNQGITEQRAREIYSEMSTKTDNHVELENEFHWSTAPVSYLGSDKFDILNYSIYDCHAIETIIIAQGNDATHRIWLCKLCEENKYPELIEKCIEKMKNSAEMAHAIATLVEIGEHDTVYCRLLEDAITNDVYRKQVIEKYLEFDLDKYICPIFSKMTNNKYKFDVLTTIYGTRVELFDSLYNGGTCFTNETYLTKMKNFLTKNSQLFQ